MKSFWVYMDTTERHKIKANSMYEAIKKIENSEYISRIMYNHRVYEIPKEDKNG